MDTLIIEMPEVAMFDTQELKLKVSNYIKALAAKLQKTEDISSDAMSQIATLSSYEEDWDGYGAAAVNSKAIRNCRQLFHGFTCNDPLALELMPSHHGAVIIKYKVGDVTLRGELGPDTISYYVRRKGKQTEYHNDETWNKDTISTLRKAIANAQ